MTHVVLVGVVLWGVGWGAEHENINCQLYGLGPIDPLSGAVVTRVQEVQ